MSKSCCGGGRSKEPMGWDGWLFMFGGIGWVICTAITEETKWKQLGEIGQYICGVVFVVIALYLLVRPRPKRNCDHHDHPD